jgi:hypothetical protein
MNDDKLKKQEDEARDIISALGRLSSDAQASPKFLGQVLAKADQLSPPRRRFSTWFMQLTVWPSSMGARLAFAALLVIAIIGAVPQYIAWTNSYIMSDSSSAIFEASLQDRLYIRNLACYNDSNNYTSLNSDYGAVTILACPTGDVHVTLEPQAKDLPSIAAWFPAEDQSETLSLFDWFVPKAYADGPPQVSMIAAAPIIKIICQKLISKHRIMRRVKYQDGRCADEIINTQAGRIVERRDAPCTPNC